MALELGLDITILVILRWFLDFIKSGKMDTLSETQANGTKQLYYWVSYSTILSKFPIFRIANLRVIARKFDYLVTAGVLKKHITKKKNGTRTYFCIVEDVFRTLDFSYSNNSCASSTDFDGSKQYLSSVLENSSSKETMQKASASGLKSTVGTVLESNVGTVLESSMPTVLKSTTKDSSYINNSSLNDNKEAAAVNAITAVENKCKQTSSELVFSKVEYQKMCEHLLSSELSIEYIEWLFSYNAKNSPKSVKRYFLKTFFEDDVKQIFLAQYKNTERNEPKEKICAACGFHYTGNIYECPECGFKYFDRGNPEKIEEARWKNSLTPAEFDKFNEELSKIINEKFEHVADYTVELENLKSKFGFVHSV